MKLSHVGSAVWFCAVVGLSTVAARGERSANEDRHNASIAADGKVVNSTAHGRSVVDANGVAVPIAHYMRVASATSLGDGVLLEILEPERILALSHWGRVQTSEPQRYGARKTVPELSDIESLRSLGADLVLVNHLGSESQLARLRESGLCVFNLGEMRGMATLSANIDAIAQLIGEPARGTRLRARLTRRMAAIADQIPMAERKHAVYVSIYGTTLYGGTQGTSYHDVLLSAGLIDAAAERFTHWPHYDPEELLSLDPELVITHRGMASTLCAVHGLERLRACRAGQGRVVEVDDALVGDPGPRMLEAAEALYDAVYRSRD